MSQYTVGDRPRFTVTFLNTAGVATDPTSVQFVTKVQGKTAETLYTYPNAAITKDSVGVYTFTHPRIDKTLAGGKVTIRANGNGTLEASKETTFTVADTAFAVPLP